MNLKNRLDRLSRYQQKPPVILLHDDEEPTPAQLLDMARAEVAGVEPFIIRFNGPGNRRS